MRDLHLMVPGLAAWLEIPRGDVIPLPALTRLLKAGRALEGDLSLSAGLCRLFGVERQLDLPLAPVTALLDGVDAHVGYWLRADPVHLQTGLRGMSLLDAQQAGLTLVESVELASTLAPIFAAAGWRFASPRAGRWYVRPNREIRLFTTPLDRVAGRQMNSALPGGPAAPEVMRLLNEIQMVLHTHPVNQEREARGRAPINSLWFWGGGVLPGLNPTCRVVAGEQPEALALAELAGLPAAPCPEHFRDLPKAAGLLAVLPDFPLQAAAEAALELDQHWFRPLLMALRLGRVRRATLILSGIEGRGVEIGFLGAWRAVR